LLNRIRGKYEKILEGGAGLTLDERKAIARMAKNFYNAARTRYIQATTETSALAYELGVGEAFDRIIKSGEATPQVSQPTQTTFMTAPDGSKWNVPNAQVNLFRQNGYK